MKKLPLLHLVFIFAGGLVLLFIIAPLVGMVLRTTPYQLFDASTDPEVQRSVLLTLLVSLGATFSFALAAVPLAYLLARKNFFLKRLILAIINIPIVIPHTAAGIAILGFISRDSALGKLAGGIGLSFIGHPAGIALAMAFVSIPFLINAAHDGFMSVPERLEKAALSLGASPARVFLTISLPLAWRYILSGLIMMFARGLSEFGAVVIVAYHPMITPVLIYERFCAFGLSYARPVAVIFIAVCLAFFIVLRIISKEKKDAST
ncbi:MAG: ABC transporter permease [Bacteroidia bacterium]|nr:ABC transporter permease [Bacteroidia bacterium]